MCVHSRTMYGTITVTLGATSARLKRNEVYAEPGPVVHSLLNYSWSTYVALCVIRVLRD